MDPTRARARLSQLASRLVQGDPSDLEWQCLLAIAEEAAEAFIALDDWIRSGGFLPTACQSGAEARTAKLERACRGLLQDVSEVLERKGETWWDETVTSGLHHRQLAERLLASE